MAELVLLAGLGDESGSVTTTDDDGGAVLGGLDAVVQKGVGTTGEVGELEDTGGTVPENGLGLGDGIAEELAGLGSTVQTLPVRGDTLLVSGRADLGILVELVGRDVVNGKDDLDVVGFGLLNELLDLLGTLLVEERLADLDISLRCGARATTGNPPRRCQESS